MPWHCPASEARSTLADRLWSELHRLILMTGGGFDEIESAVGERRPHLLSKPYSRKDLEGIIWRARSS